MQSLPFESAEGSGYGRLAGPERLRASCLLSPSRRPIPQYHGHRGARVAAGAVLELYLVSAIAVVSIGSGVSGLRTVPGSYLCRVSDCGSTSPLLDVFCLSGLLRSGMLAFIKPRSLRFHELNLCPLPPGGHAKRIFYSPALACLLFPRFPLWEARVGDRSRFGCVWLVNLWCLATVRQPQLTMR